MRGSRVEKRISGVLDCVSPLFLRPSASLHNSRFIPSSPLAFSLPMDPLLSSLYCCFRLPLHACTLANISQCTHEMKCILGVHDQESPPSCLILTLLYKNLQRIDDHNVIHQAFLEIYHTNPTFVIFHPLSFQTFLRSAGSYNLFASA